MENDAKCRNVAAKTPKTIKIDFVFHPFVSVLAEKYMHHSIGYTSGNAISLFSWNQVKNTTLLLTALIFVRLNQQNPFRYHQDPYIPTGAKYVIVVLNTQSGTSFYVQSNSFFNFPIMLITYFIKMKFVNKDDIEWSAWNDFIGIAGWV